jgi:asparagine synthase (glutamine-hydrolysing)
MCGIVGIVSRNASEYIQTFTHKISHRGPDDFGYFVSKNISLGHRRLSIIDLSSNGHQPMYSLDNNYVVVFNGEIYNHLEIRKSLEEKYKFKSQSDTETVVYGYIEYGVKFFNMLNGIFALSIFNKLTQELIIVRDQFGVKPLYYYLDSENLIFSSELKSFANYSGLKNDINYSSLVNYINYLWSPGEMTPFANVKKLLPGHYMILNVNDLATVSNTKYYDINFDGKYFENNEEELIDRLDELLENAVRRQLLSDVPVGFFLSGGVDSSLIVAYARKINPTSKIECFTIDSGVDTSSEGFSDDLEYAKIVAKHLDVNLNIIDADIDIVRDFDKMIYHLDEPQADAAPLNVLNICKEARKNGFKVLLGGTAGDDLFSGYRRHKALKLEKYYKLFPVWLLKIYKKLVSNLNSKIPLFRRLRKASENVDKSKLERMTGYFSWIPLHINKSLFALNIQDKIKDYKPDNYLADILHNIPEEKSDLNKMLYWEMKSFLVDHNLNYTDKLGMAVGVEIRVPFLDLELVEFSTKIPPSLKMKGNTTKYLLKKVAERYLPNEVIYRKKTGFGAPIRKWITTDMDSMINDRLSRSNIEAQGLFNFEAVFDLIEKNKKGEIDASYTIWSLLAIESWYTQFVNKL